MYERVGLVMQVVKPIFIIGAGRSGSTVFHGLFAEHPYVSWLSNLCDKYPASPEINRRLMQTIDIPVIGRYLKHRFDPDECYRFWDHYCKGFSTPCRDLLSTDVSNHQKKTVQDVMTKMLTKHRNRLLIKITGWPRIGFLKEIFPEAKFVHVIRDGRAVVNSTINVDFWWGWRGPQNWRWGDLNPEQYEEWRRFDRSFVALAAIQWKIIMDAVDEAREMLCDDDYIEIKYEQLCTDVIGVFRKVLDFVDLDSVSQYEKLIKKYPISSRDYKWKTDLTSKQQEILESILGGHLQKYGYT